MLKSVKNIVYNNEGCECKLRNVKCGRSRDRETGEYEPVDTLLKRFKKMVDKAEVLKDCRKHEFFIKKSLKRKQKMEEHRKMMKTKASKQARTKEKQREKRKKQTVEE